MALGLKGHIYVTLNPFLMFILDKIRSKTLTTKLANVHFFNS
jgi:hypothetical protein